MTNLIKITLGIFVLATGIAHAEVCIRLTDNNLGSTGNYTIFRVTAIDKNPLKKNVIISKPIPYGTNINYYFKAPDVSSLNGIKIETITTTGNHQSTLKLQCQNLNIQVPTASADISISQDYLDKGQCLLSTLSYQQPMTPCSN